MYRTDYMHAQFPPLGFPVGLPVKGEGNKKWKQLCRKSIHVQQIPSQIPKEKSLRKCSLIVSDQNASAGSWSSNTLHNRLRVLVGFVLLPTSSSHRTPTTVCSFIKGHKELPPVVSSEAKPAGMKAQPNLHEKLPNNCRKMVFRGTGVILPGLPY